MAYAPLPPEIFYVTFTTYDPQNVAILATMKEMGGYCPKCGTYWDAAGNRIEYECHATREEAIRTMSRNMRRHKRHRFLTFLRIFHECMQEAVNHYGI